LVAILGKYSKLASVGEKAALRSTTLNLVDPAAVPSATLDQEQTP
jgi:myo-inositol-1(or 4)-monophosphatase